MAATPTRRDGVAAALQILSRDDIAGDRSVELVAVDRAVPVAFHAAYLDPRIGNVELHGGIRSWVDDVVARPTQPNLMEHAVPGALCCYDLPDLRRAIDPTFLPSSD